MRYCHAAGPTPRPLLRPLQLAAQHESAFALFKAELRSVLDGREASTRRDLELVRGELEKLRGDTKYDIEKLIASQRLDLNLEKGRMRDELQSSNAKAVATEIRLQTEVSNVRTILEANKNEIIRFSVGAVASTTAVGLGILRLMM